MEEDIKILEELIKKVKEQGLGQDLAKLIEKLIKGYKEKEEVVNDVKALAKNLKDYIPKTKIKEIIEELDSKSKYCAISDLTEYMYKKEVLLELLEDK